MTILCPSDSPNTAPVTRSHHFLDEARPHRRSLHLLIGKSVQVEVPARLCLAAMTAIVAMDSPPIKPTNRRYRFHPPTWGSLIISKANM